MSRTIGVVTTARSDYGIYRPILKRIMADPDVALMLFVGGMHLAPEFGRTIREILDDGFPIAETVEGLLSSDTAEGTSKSIGLSIVGYAQAFARSRPDVLLILGDRFEMFAAAAAAAPMRIPMAHVHGGEASIGAIDEVIRHAMTKLATLHFPTTQAYADRIIAMGERPSRVVLAGAPALDGIDRLPPADAGGFSDRFGVPLDPPPLLVTYHPVTLEPDGLHAQIDAMLGAIDDVALPALLTDPNADEGGRTIRERVVEFAATRPQVRHVPNLGRDAYFDALRLCSAMVGNSSSGLIEAPSFRLPVVNIGTRQEGRIRAKNVIDVGYDRSAIAAAIRRAVSAEFKASLADVTNPYFHGGAADLIVGHLKSVTIDDQLLRKKFYERASA